MCHPGAIVHAPLRPAPSHRAGKAEVERRAHLRSGGPVAETRVMRERAAEGGGACQSQCHKKWNEVCESCRWKIMGICNECVEIGALSEGGTCKACKTALRDTCTSCTRAMSEMCAECRERVRKGERLVSNSAQMSTVEDIAQARWQERKRKHNAQNNETNGQGKMKARDMRRQTRWRRRQNAEGEDTIEYDMTGTGRWQQQFVVRQENAGRYTLHAARMFRMDEFVTVYVGRNYGKVGTTDGESDRRRLIATSRIEHVVVVGGVYVDVRDSETGAQYIRESRQDTTQCNAVVVCGTGNVKVTAARGINKGDEIVVPVVVRPPKDPDMTGDVRAGGSVAYTVHDGGRVVYVEELLTAGTRGHGLRTGWRLLAVMLEMIGCEADEIHLIVRKDNGYARQLYEQAAFKHSTRGLYKPHAHEMYMVADVADMAWRIASSDVVSQGTLAGWEVEVCEIENGMRTTDATWVREMYGKEHAAKSKRQRETSYPHEARHVLMWHRELSIEAYDAARARSMKVGDSRAASSGEGAAKRSETGGDDVKGDDTGRPKRGRARNEDASKDVVAGRKRRASGVDDRRERDMRSAEVAQRCAEGDGAPGSSSAGVEARGDGMEVMRGEMEVVPSSEGRVKGGMEMIEQRRGEVGATSSDGQERGKGQKRRREEGIERTEGARRGHKAKEK